MSTCVSVTNRCCVKTAERIQLALTKRRSVGQLLTTPGDGGTRPSDVNNIPTTVACLSNSESSFVFKADMDMGWVNPWVGFGWVGFDFSVLF